MVRGDSGKVRFFLILSILLVVVITIGILITTHYLGKIVESHLQKSLGPGFTIGKIEVGLTSVSVKDIQLKDLKRNIVRLEASDLSIAPSLKSLFSRTFVIKSVSLKSSSILVEKTRSGRILMPIELPGEKKKGHKRENERGDKTFRLHINRISIINGTFLFIDHSVTPPVRVEMKSMNVTLENVDYPASLEKTFMDVIGLIPSKGPQGKMHIRGWIKLANEDSYIKVNLSELDLALLSPYVSEKSTVKVASGSLSLKGKIEIENKKIDAPGTLLLKDLAFRGNALTGLFLGIPVGLLSRLLQKEGGIINIPFEVKGDLNEPEFSLRRELVLQVVQNLVEKVGRLPKSVTEQVNPEKLKSLGKGLEGLIRGLLPQSSDSRD